ncbi:unnamed protein product [Symbiodinium pilosum]|uniref:Uncharacterized protein n=1 Tax=Symbiodinium pilosum TaxID=2952 RepID=A0A812PMB0_SYMPI|nr:unnamed protein product [Symbiodinium pilosum]
MWKEGLLLWLLLAAGQAQQTEEDALRLHLTEQALVREVRSQARQVAESSGLAKISGPLSVLRLLETQLEDLKGHVSANVSSGTDNLSDIREEAASLECTTDHLLAKLSEVLEALEHVLLARNRTIALEDAVRQFENQSDAGSGGHSCGERRRLRRRLQQIRREVLGAVAEKEDLQRLLKTMRVHVDRIQEEAMQGERALNATRALEEKVKDDVLQEERSYEKVLQDLTDLNDARHVKVHQRQEDSVPGNRSVESSNMSTQSVKTTSGDTTSGGQELRLLAQRGETSKRAIPDEYDGFQKGRQATRKRPCNPRIRALPGHVDSFATDPDLGSAPNTSAELSSSPTPTTTAKSSTSTSATTTTTASTTVTATVSANTTTSVWANTSTTMHSSITTTQHSLSTSVQVNGTEPEGNFPNLTVTDEPDSATDAAADDVLPEQAPSKTGSPATTTGPSKTPQVHEESWPVRNEDGEWGVRAGAAGTQTTETTTSEPASNISYKEIDWEADRKLWSKQERLAQQLANLSQRWELAKNRSRGLLKARLVADDAARQLHAAVENHFKAIQLVSTQFNTTKAKLSKLRGRAKIAHAALRRQPRCRAAEKRRRREALESKVKEAESDLQRRRGLLEAQNQQLV